MRTGMKSLRNMRCMSQVVRIQFKWKEVELLKIIFIGKSIVFEDEKYTQEKGETLLSHNVFQYYLEDFINEKPNFVLLDTNGELNQTLFEQNSNSSEHLKVSEVNNSSIKKKLEQDITHYEKMIKTDQFSSKTDKNSAKILLSTLKKQLKAYDQRITQSIKPPMSVSSSQQYSKEEMRDRGMREIFSFYARQHIPVGIAFEELEAIMKQVDLGEFTSF